MCQCTLIHFKRWEMLLKRMEKDILPVQRKISLLVEHIKLWGFENIFCYIQQIINLVDLSIFNLNGKSIFTNINQLHPTTLIECINLPKLIPFICQKYSASLFLHDHLEWIANWINECECDYVWNDIIKISWK